MRVLVTGATGMLGRAVASSLAERGDAVTVFQRRPSGLDLPERLGDIADRSAVYDAVHGQDAVIHLAAKVNVVGPWREYVRANVEGTRNLLEATARSSVERVVTLFSIKRS